jgi:hypothetical protein
MEGGMGRRGGGGGDKERRRDGTKDKRGGDEGWERRKGGVWDRMENEAEKVVEAGLRSGRCRQRMTEGVCMRVCRWTSAKQRNISNRE